MLKFLKPGSWPSYLLAQHPPSPRPRLTHSHPRVQVITICQWFFSYPPEPSSIYPTVNLASLLCRSEAFKLSALAIFPLNPVLFQDSHLSEPAPTSIFGHMQETWLFLDDSLSFTAHLIHHQVLCTGSPKGRSEPSSYCFHDHHPRPSLHHLPSRLLLCQPGLLLTRNLFKMPFWPCYPLCWSMSGASHCT